MPGGKRRQSERKSRLFIAVECLRRTTITSEVRANRSARNIPATGG